MHRVVILGGRLWRRVPFVRASCEAPNDPLDARRTGLRARPGEHGWDPRNTEAKEDMVPPPKRC